MTKTVKILALAIALMTSLTLSAQKPASWSGVRFSYDNIKLDETTLNGASATYVKAWQLSQKVPVYFEAGLNVDWGIKSSNILETIIGIKGNEDATMNLVNLSIPLNVGYYLPLIGDTFAVAPYAGLDGKVYVYGNLNGLSQDFNIFDKDKLGETFAASRWQAGWHVGVNLHISRKYVVGASYGADFTKFQKNADTKIKKFQVNLGYNF